MRLCYVGWGDHVHLERWAGYFARAGHEVSVISLSETGRYPENVVQYRLRRGVLRRLSHQVQLLYLRWWLFRLRPDVVHVHWAPFANLLRDCWSGPLAITAWGSDIYQLPNDDSEERHRTLAALRAADCVTCDSEDLAATIRTLAGLSKNTLHVIQWGVDTDLFRPVSGPTRLAESLGIVGRPVVLSPRNFTPLYNLDAVVRAFAVVVQRMPDAVLLMKRYSDAPDYVRRIESLIRELGLGANVHLVGQLSYEEMPDFYRTGQILVSAPSSDGTPMSLLEGLACGCVPVLSDLPSIREWVTDGVNGLLVPGGSVDKLAAAILAGLERAREPELLARNRALVERRASQHANMQQMEQLYRVLATSSTKDTA